VFEKAELSHEISQKMGSGTVTTTTTTTTTTTATTSEMIPKIPYETLLFQEPAPGHPRHQKNRKK